MFNFKLQNYHEVTKQINYGNQKPFANVKNLLPLWWGKLNQN